MKCSPGNIFSCVWGRVWVVAYFVASRCLVCVLFIIMCVVVWLNVAVICQEKKTVELALLATTLFQQFFKKKKKKKKYKILVLYRGAHPPKVPTLIHKKKDRKKREKRNRKNAAEPQDTLCMLALVLPVPRMNYGSEWNRKKKCVESGDVYPVATQKGNCTTSNMFFFLKMACRPLAWPDRYQIFIKCGQNRSKELLKPNWVSFFLLSSVRSAEKKQTYSGVHPRVATLIQPSFQTNKKK